MAEWEHKERIWMASNWYHDSEGERVSEKGFMPFDSWLNMQCEGGWEVFNISRNPRDATSRTWCIFRRLV